MPRRQQYRHLRAAFTEDPVLLPVYIIIYTLYIIIFKCVMILFNLSSRSLEFVDCEEPLDLKGNKTARDEIGYGCLRVLKVIDCVEPKQSQQNLLFIRQMGGQRYEDVEKTKVVCSVLPGIECYGERKFLRDGSPCVRYVSRSLMPLNYVLHN